MPDERGLLALTRKVGQSILIGPDIEVELVEAKGSNARILVRAPKSVRVRRKELGPDPKPEGGEAA